MVIGTVGPFAAGDDHDNGWTFSNELGLDMVDEHYYVPPQWFWDHQQRYDAYDRTRAKVYVGEYAAHESDRRNTLRSALAEAAGLAAFERNGDLVHFASYAPLLARRDHTQWTPDMIYFNATEVFLTPNYYVQQLFGHHGGDRYHDTVISGAAEGTKLAASTVVDSRSGDVIVKIVNGAGGPADLDVRLDGLADGRVFAAERIVLTGPGVDAVNDDGQAPAVHPESESTEVSARFDYTAPATSLTIFRIHRR